MPRNVTYHNPINQEENTPLVKILETNTAKKQSTAVDARHTPYVIDLSKASFGGTTYPEPGSQWYLKKISGVWTLMARAPQQNPQLDPALTPQPGDTIIGHGGVTIIAGDVEINGQLDTNDEIIITRANATDAALATRITTDTVPRWLVTADGKFTWGAGGVSAGDVNLYRSGANQLRTDDELQSNRSSGTANAFSAFTTGDTQVRWQAEANGSLWWGSGSAAVDTNLYRSDVDELSTDSVFAVNNDVFFLGSIALVAGDLEVDGEANILTDLQFDGTSLGRGILAYVYSNSDTSAISTGTALTTSNVDWVSGRAYEMSHGTSYTSSIANNQATMFLRAGSGAPSGGTVHTAPMHPGVTATAGQMSTWVYPFICTSNQNGPAAAVIASGTGTTTGKGASGRYILVKDIGPSSLLSGAPSI